MKISKLSPREVRSLLRITEELELEPGFWSPYEVLLPMYSILTGFPSILYCTTIHYDHLSFAYSFCGLAVGWSGSSGFGQGWHMQLQLSGDCLGWTIQDGLAHMPGASDGMAGPLSTSLSPQFSSHNVDAFQEH